MKNEVWVEVKVGPFGEPPEYYWIEPIDPDFVKGFLKDLMELLGPPDPGIGKGAELNPRGCKEKTI